MMKSATVLMSVLAVLAVCLPVSAGIKSISASDLDASYVYSNGVGTMSISDAAVIDVEYVDSTHLSYNPATVSFSGIKLDQDYSAGGKADADFIGGVLLYTQGTTELLKCNLLALSLTETRTASNVLSGFGSFQVVSGTLAQAFGSEGEIYWLEFQLSVPITSFSTSFTGRTDLSIIPTVPSTIPEPATLAVLGLGAALLRRRFA